MRVAVLAPISWRTPPENYGPWELCASLVTEGLVERGHEVTLFATGDSITKAKLEAVVPRGLDEEKFAEGEKKISKYRNLEVDKYLHIANCFEKAEDFDIIHNNFNYGPLAFSKLVKTPIVTTLHSGTIEFADERTLEIYKKYNANNYYVSISNAARHPELNYVGTVYHGIDVEKSMFGREKGEYLLTLGRIDEDKGTSEAIQAAKRTGKKLIMAGIVTNEAYFREKVEPFVDGEQIQFVGVKGGEEKQKLLAGAEALLHLIGFDEPFGISVIEAQAAGTPVIAYERGAMAEIIKDGVNGYLAHNLDEVVEKIGEIEKIERSGCRKYVADNFSLKQMVDGYVKIFEQVLEKSK